MAAFTLLNLASKETVDRTYDDGKRAAKIAARLTRMTGRKYQVRKLEDDEGDPNWREREANRFETGEYIPVIEQIQHISPPDFFPHVAKKSPDLIAYTKDEARGRADKQSLLSVRAYIDMCFTVEPMLSRCKEWALEWGYKDDLEAFFRNHYTSDWRDMCARKQIEAAFEHTCPVKFAGPLPENFTDEDVKRIGDEIERVYTHYNSEVSPLHISCMRYRASSYGGRVDGVAVHPTQAYASPNLAIAYITDKDGRTKARALCWPEKKIYSRVYADSDALQNALKAMGYRKSGYYQSYSSSVPSFDGARLRRIVTDSGNQVVVPYLDDPNKYLEDTGEWLVMGGEQINAETTAGVADIDGESDGVCCDHCGERVDEDDLRIVYLNGRRTSSETWCEHCRDNYGFYCYGEDEWFDSDVPHDEVDGEVYSTRFLESYAHFCQRYDYWTFDDMTEVVTTMDGGMQMWCDDAVSDHAYMWGDVYYSDDIDAVEVVCERYVERLSYGWHRASYYIPDIVWYADRIERVPEFLIEDGEVDVYTGVDGRMYLRDYVDNYPVDRPRVAEDGEIVESWVTQAYMPHSDEVNRLLERQRIKEEEAAPKKRSSKKTQPMAIDVDEAIPVTIV